MNIHLLCGGLFLLYTMHYSQFIQIRRNFRVANDADGDNDFGKAHIKCVLSKRTKQIVYKIVISICATHAAQ